MCMGSVSVSRERFDRMKGGMRRQHLTAGAGENNSQVDVEEMINETPWAIHHEYVTVSSFSPERSR